MLLALVAGSVCGCQAINPVGDTFTADLPTDAPARSTLNDKQTAKLCLATAEGLLAEGHHAKAAVLFEKARQHNGKLEVSHPLANAYAQLDMPERAIREYERAISESPNDANRLNDFGCFYLRRDEVEKAEQLLRSALEQQADHPQAIMNLGECYLRSGRVD
ncbi:MAG: tetratricopeptide repeat protein, partial [Planctomycetota bacterium]